MNVDAIFSGRLLCDLIYQLTRRAEIDHSFTVFAPSPLRDEEPDESLAAPCGQLKSDIRILRVDGEIAAQEVCLVG
jgi:hypothetical protein